MTDSVDHSLWLQRGLSTSLTPHCFHGGAISVSNGLLQHDVTPQGQCHKWPNRRWISFICVTPISKGQKCMKWGGWKKNDDS